MHKRQGLVVLVTFALYLIIGGTVFMTMENAVTRVEESPELDVLENFVEFLIVENETSDIDKTFISRDEWNDQILEALQNFSRRLPPPKAKPLWTFFDGIFFCLTVVTTIGYGNISPSSEVGQLFCVLYGLVGIPLTGILLAGIGDFFSGKLMKIHEANKSNSSTPKWNLFCNTVMYLIPGFILFLFLPAGVFIALENWTFVEGLYYAFVTLTTIGFGDYVAATRAVKSQWLYKLGLIAWIVIGLGYFAMIISFIAKAMKSKQMKKLEKTFVKNLKHTHTVLTKEVEYFMRTMNDFYMNKIKVHSGTMTRTSSCPSLDRPMHGLKRRSNSTTSIPELADYVNHSETSANFLFDLARAMTCADLETHDDPRVDVSRKSSIAHLLSLVSLMPPYPPPPTRNHNPRLRSSSTIVPPDPANLSRTSLRRSLPPSTRDHLFRTESLRNKTPPVTRVRKSSAFLDALLFPMGMGAPNKDDDYPRFQSEQYINNVKLATDNALMNSYNTTANNVVNVQNNSISKGLPNDNMLMRSISNPASFNYTDKFVDSSFRNKFCGKTTSPGDSDETVGKATSSDDDSQPQQPAFRGGLDDSQRNGTSEYWMETEMTGCSTIQEEEKSDLESNTSPSVSVANLSDRSNQVTGSQETMDRSSMMDCLVTDPSDGANHDSNNPSNQCIINMENSTRNESTDM